MAKNTKPKPNSLVNNFSTKKQLKLAAGFIILLVGIFIGLSIVSYFLTWQADQNYFFDQKDLNHFLFKDNQPVANWGGRFGAAISHFLVYRGLGIASFGISVLLIFWGTYIIYGKRKFAILRYLRWISILMLVLAPILSYLFPHAEFAFGGAVGASFIDQLNSLIGRVGTGLLLLGFTLFFLFVIVAIDIKPMLQQAKKTANAVGGGLGTMKDGLSNGVESLKDKFQKNTPDENELADDDKQSGNLLSSEEVPKLIIDDDVPLGEYNLSIDEKNAQAPAASAEPALPTQKESTADWKTPLATSTGQSQDELDLSFEVNTAKEEETITATAHGAHVSIEDNEPYDPENDLPSYKFPTLDLLEDRHTQSISLDKEELEKNKNQIIQTLKSFGIEIQKISATVGPTVTLYEIIPAEGVRISKIRNLEDDIALNLAALGIRIIAPIPGKGTIGIEVPNAKKQIVSMRAMLSSEKFVNSKMSLPIALGKKIDNENYIVDLATMPHLLVAGATGQGKSVGINAILVSLLYKKHPSQLKLVLVDPKKVELSIYRTIEKHYLAKLPNEEEAIITDTKKVIYTLNALCIEMDDRYELLKEAGTRNIKEYNEKFVRRRLNPEKGHKYLPFIVLVVDEFADLIMTAGKEVEVPIARLAQLARAVGIHLIIATQRPSVNVITGTIKANFPARIAFKVSAKVDSRTILDTGGAEQLIGKGDMLVSHGSELLRLQCAFVDTPEVDKITDFIGGQRGYPHAFELPEYEGEEADDKNFDLSNRDKLFEECAKLVVNSGNGSTSNLQRRMNLGYNRAGRIMDQLEAAGIVGPAAGSKPREVLYQTEAELIQFLENLN